MHDQGKKAKAEPMRRVIKKRTLTAPPLHYGNYVEVSGSNLDVTIRVFEIIQATDETLTVRETGAVVMPPSVARQVHGILGGRLDEVEKILAGRKPETPSEEKQAS